MLRHYGGGAASRSFEAFGRESLKGVKALLQTDGNLDDPRALAR